MLLPRRLPLAGLLTGLIAAIVLLGWELSQGGIERHHLLSSADMPGISNLWALLVMPVLGLISGLSLKQRALSSLGARRGLWIALALAAAGGVALSIAFSLDLGDAALAVLAVLALGSLFVRAYRPEYLFAFVLGALITFGPIIPLLPGLPIMLLSAVAQRVIRPLLGWLWRVARSSRT